MNSLNGVHVVAGDIVKLEERFMGMIPPGGPPKITVTVTEIAFVEVSESTHDKVLVGLTSEGINIFVVREWKLISHQQLNADRRERPVVYSCDEFQKLFPGYSPYQARVEEKLLKQNSKCNLPSSQKKETIWNVASMYDNTYKGPFTANIKNEDVVNSAFDKNSFRKMFPNKKY